MEVGFIITLIGMVSVFLLLAIMVGAVKLLSLFASGKSFFTRRNSEDKNIAIALAAFKHSLS